MKLTIERLEYDQWRATLEVYGDSPQELGEAAGEDVSELLTAAVNFVNGLIHIDDCEGSA